MSQDIDCLITPINSSDIVQADKDEQVYETNPPKLRQHIAAIAATLSAVASGIVLGWTSPIMTDLENGNFHHIPINATEMGWIGSFVTLGGMTMCLPTGFICDMFGRKRTLLLLVVPFVIGWSLILFACNIIMLYFGRLLTGMAAGACCIAAPLYTSEIAHKSIRGFLGTYFQLMVNVGIFLAYLFGTFFKPQGFTWACALVPIIFLFIFAWQPESPVYLLKRNLIDQARDVLLILRGPEYNIESEINEIDSTLKDNSLVAVSLLDTFKKVHVQKAMLISFVLMFLQQFSGINTIVLYSTDIFKMAGLKLDPHSASIIVGACLVISTLVAALAIDKLGRRCLLLTSIATSVVTNIMLAIYFTFKYREHWDDHSLSKLGFLPLSALCIFVCAFSLGLGPIPWLISAEIFAPEIKSFCSAIAGTINWFLAFIITKFYKEVADFAGEDTVFYVFAGCSFIGFLFVLFAVPETKGKSVAQIQIDLGAAD